MYRKLEAIFLNVRGGNWREEEKTLGVKVVNMKRNHY
jgi:hypothetical protein